MGGGIRPALFLCHSPSVLIFQRVPEVDMVLFNGLPVRAAVEPARRELVRGAVFDERGAYVDRDDGVVETLVLVVGGPRK